VRARIGTSVNRQNLSHGVRRKGTIRNVKIKRPVELPLIPQCIDHSDVEIGPAFLDYNVLESGNHLIFALHYLQDQFDLFCLLIRQLSKSPNNVFPYAFAVPVGFSDGVRLIGLPLICGGTVAQVHDISSSSSVTTLPFKNPFVNPFITIFLEFEAAFCTFILRLQYHTELRKSPKNKDFVKTFPE
jgi:hypothetical protein